MLLVGTVAAFCAFFIKGLTGFANTLVFSSILSFFTANRNITPIDLLLGLPANFYIAWKERKGIRPGVVLPLTATLLIGMLPGTLLLRSGDERLIKLVLGVSIVALAAEMLQRERAVTTRPPKRWLLRCIAVVSGFLCGLFGIGAFLVAYISRTTSSTGELRGNICCVFVVENLARLGLYVWLGILHPQIFRQAALLLPGMAAGLLCGFVFAKKLPEAKTRRVITLLLFLMGFSVIANNLF